MTDHSNQRVQAFNQTTSAFSSVVYATSGTPNMFGIAVDSSTGNIFYSESNFGTVKRLDYPSWGAIPVAGFFTPRGIALDSAGNVYIAEKKAF
jgi:DNA-binding beta-propeller fold protein YncE